MKLSRLLIVPALAAGLGACANDPYDPYGRSSGLGGLTTGTTLSTLGGAAVGGLAGSQLGSGTGNIAATAGGVILGGILGNQLGQALDRNDQAAAVRAQNQALATNAPITWNDPQGNVYGTVQPVRTYQSNGRYCRDYVHTVYIDGRAREAQGVACQQADGSWQIVS